MARGILRTWAMGRIGRSLLRGLLVSGRWIGVLRNGSRQRSVDEGIIPTFDLAHYLEHSLPERMRRSPLAKALPSGMIFVLDVRGREGGTWSCHCDNGRVAVEHGLAKGATVTYRLESTTLEQLIRGSQTAQQAFFAGRIDIDGDMEKALKMAMLIEEFLGETTPQTKEHHVCLSA